jgi:hypothetical protein
MEHQQALRNFAYVVIPRLLRASGGRLEKPEMRAEIRRQFEEGGRWAEELDRVHGGGCTVWLNEIAWAMSKLVVERVIRPSSGQTFVELR